MPDNPNATADSFLYQNIPASDAEAVSENPSAFASRIAKTAMVGYFKRYFDGDLSHVLRSLAPRTAVELTTDSLRVQDEDKHFLQIAKKVAKLWQRLPCILVIDTGSQITTPGLGSYDRKTKRGDKIIYTRARVFTINMEFAAGHQTEDGAAELQEVVSLMLENRDRIGSIITQNNWEVRLPMTHQRTQITAQQVGDDNTQTFAVGSVNADIQVEVWYYEEVPAQGVPTMTGNPSGAPNIQALRKVDYPHTVRLHQKPKLAIRGYPPTLKVLTDDPTVAIITEDRYILPLKVGTCRIVLVDRSRGVDDAFPLAITV